MDRFDFEKDQSIQEMDGRMDYLSKRKKKDSLTL